MFEYQDSTKSPRYTFGLSCTTVIQKKPHNKSSYLTISTWCNIKIIPSILIWIIWLPCTSVIKKKKHNKSSYLTISSWCNIKIISSILIWIIVLKGLRLFLFLLLLFFFFLKVSSKQIWEDCENWNWIFQKQIFT